MKKNKKTYLLLTCVLVIWGILGVKIIGSLNSSPKKVKTTTAMAAFNPTRPMAKDTFSIAANYRDPFLGTIRNTKSKLGKKTITKVETPKKNISYTGFITDTGSKKKIFFVTIDGQQYMMGLKDKIQEVKLVSGNKFRIRVSYSGKVHNIPIAQ